MKKKRRAAREFARQAGILHAWFGRGKVKVFS
jgi:hypothetical protein